MSPLEWALAGEIPKALLASVLELLAERKVNHPGAALTRHRTTSLLLGISWLSRLHCLILRRSQMLGKKLRAHTGMSKRWAISSTGDFSWNLRTTRFVSRILRPCYELGVATKSRRIGCATSVPWTTTRTLVGWVGTPLTRTSIRAGDENRTRVLALAGTLRRRVRRSPRQLVERRQGQSPAFLQCRSRGDGGQAGGSGHRRKTGTALAAGTSVSGNDPRGSPRIPRQCGCSYPLRERLATNSGPRILDKSRLLLARDVEFCSMSSQRSKSLSATSWTP
jgi:hypothetical protein